jgi:type IX secretion system PorP/SprF family membrane protein
MKTMNWNKIFKATLFGAILVSTNLVEAQDIHFTQFAASPLTLNPALTGHHNGMWRATAIHRNQWGTVTVPFVTSGVSFDLPLARKIGQDDYLAAGLQLYTDKSGDGALTNNTALVSVAYHKFLGMDAKSAISLGMQGGFFQKSIDIPALYFSDQFHNGGYSPGTSLEDIKPKTSNMLAAIGLNFDHSFGEKFSIQVGAGAHNINQPRESLLRKESNEVGLGMRINSLIGADWKIGERLSILPAIMFQTQTNASELVAGLEAKMILGEPEIKSVATSLFLGAYTRTGDALLITGGIEFKGFRLGTGYDITGSKLKSAAPGTGAYEIALTYIKPNPLDFARKVYFPCARF